MTENNRRTKFLKRWNMFNDNYSKQVTDRLVEIYSKANIIGMDKQVDLTNNVYKTLVEKISRVYSFGINRDFKDNAATKNLYRDARIDKYMKQANIYYNAFNDVLLQVSWNENTNLPHFNFRLPHRTKVTMNDLEEVIEVEYFVTSDDSEEKWAFWSDTEHYYKLYTKNGEVIKEMIEGNEEGINPYGVLPFLVMQKGFRDGEFFDIYSGDDLINITLDSAIYSTFKNYLIKWQSFKQMVVTGMNVGAIDGQLLDPSSALTIEGEEANVTLLDLQANLEQLVNTIESSINNVAVNYNVSPSQFRLTGQVSSGFALQMENKALDEFTIAQQEDFKDYEYKLLDLLVTIAGAHGIQLTNDVDITFGDIKYSESTTETLNIHEKSIQLGLKNPVEIIAEQRDIEEDEAALVYEENIKIRNQGNEQFNVATPTTTLPELEGA